MKTRTRLRFVMEGIEGLVVFPLTLVTWPVSRRWLRNWGASSTECSRRWPGDALVAAGHTCTRATTIAAPAERVWPWLVQFGLDRAGFYSYELLERLVGIPVTNVESIEPGLQALAVGDTIRLHPRAPAIPVARVSIGRYICIGEERPASAGMLPDPNRSWSMYLEPSGADTCRFLVRSCIEPLRAPSWAKRLGLAFEAPVDFVMEQRMLRTVKRLAEAREEDSAAP